MNPSTHTLPGIAQWFRIGDREYVDKTVEVINELAITEFRMLFSWADWESPQGPAWFDEIVEIFGTKTQTRLIPDLFYTPIPKARKDADGSGRTSHPPEDLAQYACFVEEMIVRYGKYFDWVQIWNEPNWRPYWDWNMDPDARLFCEMAGYAIEVIHRHGKKAALGGLSPYETEWITLIHAHGLLERLDAVGMHFSPSWKDQRRRWLGWDIELETARAHLRGLGVSPEFWVAETGFATEAQNPLERAQAYKNQIDFFEKTRRAPADKILWFSVIDQATDHKTDNEINMSGRLEEAAYNFGLLTREMKVKPLYDHWKSLL